MPERRLSDEEAAAVFRRAAELDHLPPRAAERRFDRAAIEEIGRGVGLSMGSMRRALAELEAGHLPAGPHRARLSAPATVIAERVVALPTAAADARAQQHLRRLWLERRRNLAGRSSWAAGTGLLVRVRRRLEGQRLRLVRALDMTVLPIPDEPDCSQVRLEVDLSDERRAHTWGATAGPAVVTLATLGGLPLGLPPEVALVALPLGAAATGAAAATGLAAYRRRCAAVSEELEGVLDEVCA